MPKSLRIRQECETCDTIQGIHNQIWACGRCNSVKATKGLYQFFKDKFPTERKFYDLIPPLLEKKYLKTIYNCHLCAGTLRLLLQENSPRGQAGFDLLSVRLRRINIWIPVCTGMTGSYCVAPSARSLRQAQCKQGKCGDNG